MERKLNQSQIADQFNLSSSAIGSYERDEREPAYSHLVEFADFFNVSLDFLMCRTDERLTVKDYLQKRTYEFEEVLNSHSITVKGYELTEADKKTLNDVSVGLFWSKLQ